MFRLRTILAVARPAVIPTVWSNCLAGWWLGGAGHLGQLPFLLIGAALLYLGSVFLNDAFDADFDPEHHPSRPVPSGSISQQACWRTGVTLLLSGGLVLVGCSFTAGALGLALVFFIVLFCAVHRLWPVGPVLHGACRCLLYVLGASIAQRGVTGWSIWCGLAAGMYVSGVGYFSRMSRSAAQIREWPLLFLLAPVALALIMDVGRYRETALLLSGVLVLWCVRSLRQTFWSLEPNPGKTVSGLMAGIVFMDWLATCPTNLVHEANSAAQQVSFAFLGLFAVTVLLQTSVPDQN
jgi:UbiA prenyltransferase family